MTGAIKMAERVVDERENAYMLQQFESEANPEVHYRTTGPEMWHDTDGTLDILIAGVSFTGNETSTCESTIARPDLRCGASRRHPRHPHRRCVPLTCNESLTRGFVSARRFVTVCG